MKVMIQKVDNILNKILQIEHGFQHIYNGADKIMSVYSREECFELSLQLFKHEAYQVRMLATTILGRLATENSKFVDNNQIYRRK